MTTSPDSTPTSTSLWPALIAGGLLAGAIDAASAIHSFGWGMFYGIASGLLGSKAFPQAGGGGAAIWLLGVGCHFLIAFAASAAYGGLSKWLGFLKNHLIIGGVLCGAAVWLVMNLIVLPLSAVPFPVGPFTVEQLRMGLLFHIILVGLPIAASYWFFARRARRAGSRTP